MPAGGGSGRPEPWLGPIACSRPAEESLGYVRKPSWQLMAPALAPVHGFRDACLKVELQFSLGFAKPSPKDAFAHPSSFGPREQEGPLALPIPMPSRLCVHPQSNGRPPGGSKRGRAARGDVPLDRRDGPLPFVNVRFVSALREGPRARLAGWMRRGAGRRPRRPAPAPPYPAVRRARVMRRAASSASATTASQPAEPPAAAAAVVVHYLACGGCSTPVPLTVTSSDGWAGSLLVMVRAPGSAPTAVGA